MIKFAKVHAIKCEQVEQERKQKCITRKMSKTKESFAWLCSYKNKNNHVALWLNTISCCNFMRTIFYPRNKSQLLSH